jgi:hypothetical protein
MSEVEAHPAAADTSLEEAIAVIRRVGIGARVRFLATPVGEGLASHPLPYSARVDQLNRAGIWLEYLEGQDVPLRTAVLWPDQNFTYTEIKVLPPFSSSRPLAARDDAEEESPRRPPKRPRPEQPVPPPHPATATSAPAAATGEAAPTTAELFKMMQQMQSLLASVVTRQAPAANVAQPVDLNFSVSQVAAAMRSRSRALVETTELVINVPRLEPDRMYRCLCPQLYIEPLLSGSMSTREAESAFVQDMLILRSAFHEKYGINEMSATMIVGIQEQFVAWIRQLRVGEVLPSQVAWDVPFRIVEQLLRQFAFIKGGADGLANANKKIAEGRKSTEFDFPSVLINIDERPKAKNAEAKAQPQRPPDEKANRRH